MSPPFVFPPPPPPPPKAATQEHTPQAPAQNNAQGFRGGRGGRGRGRGRGNNHDGGGGLSRSRHHGNTALRHGDRNYSDGGARYYAQTPMTGVQQTQHPASSHPNLHFAQAQQPPTAQHFLPSLVPSYGSGVSQYNSQLQPALHPANQLPNVSDQAVYNFAAYAAQAWAAAVSQNGVPYTPPTIQTAINSGNRGSNGPLIGHDLPRSPPGNKRKHEPDVDTNTRPGRSAQRFHNKAKVQVAPAVPSFGSPLPTFDTPTKVPATADPTRSSQGKKKKKRDFNQLGLTPRGEEHEDSEEEFDEEAAFATNGGPVQFEYKGQTSTLRSTTDIAAWIEERKKRFPTKARVEQKKEEAAKRMKERAEAQRKVHKEGRADRRRESKKLVTMNDDEQQRKALEKHLAEAEKHARKAERLRMKLMERQQKSAEPTDAQNAVNQGTKLGLLYGSDTDQTTSVSASSSEPTSESDDLSESDSSGDDAPVELSSRQQGPVRLPPDEFRRQARSGICKQFLKTGHCRRTACKYKHELSSEDKRQAEPRRKKADPVKQKRLSLFQRLLEQEQSQQDMLVLQAIKYLGSNGFLA